MLGQQAAALAPRGTKVEVRSFLLHSQRIPKLSPTTGLHNIMLYLIGLGLADEADVTVKGLELIKKVERVYLEAYTSILLVDKAKLVSFFSSHHSMGLTLSFFTVGSILWPSNHFGGP